MTVFASGFVRITRSLSISLISVISLPTFSFLLSSFALASDTVILLTSGTLTSVGVVKTKAATAAARSTPITPTMISPLVNRLFLGVVPRGSSPDVFPAASGVLVTLCTSLSVLPLSGIAIVGKTFVASKSSANKSFGSCACASLKASSRSLRISAAVA